MKHTRIFSVVNRLLICTTFFCASAVEARPVEIPLVLEEGFFQRLLKQQVYTETGSEARVWDDGKNCNYLVLSEPETGLTDEKLHTRTAAVARVGTVLGNTCLSFIKWNGYIEIFQQPVLSSSPGIVDFSVVDSRIVSDDGESQGIIGTLWDWIKDYVHPRFNRVRLDIYPVLNDLKGVLSLVFPSQLQNVNQITDSVDLASVVINEQNIELVIQFHIPEFTDHIKPEKPVDTLTQEELEQWEKNWQNWDAFLTQIIKKAGTDSGLDELRYSLLSVLLDSRQDITEILSPASADTSDPVPGLFVKTWEQLAPAMQEVSEGLPSSSVFNYLGFITAANALVAIESIQEETGFTLTADAMRRMARMLLPASTRDPLLYDTAVDMELRSLFGFGSMPAPPEVDPSSFELPEPGALQREIFHTPSSVILGGIQAGMLMVIPAMVVGGDAYNLLVSRLNGRVPTINTLNEYLPLVQLLLDLIAQSTARQKQLDKQFNEIYRSLVLATAWQESCWRQYVKLKGEITPIRSHAGAVGIMQVNPYVWRGFYDVNGLQNDVGYNALAGSEILHHYLVDYAIARGEHQLEGGMENLVRATYAMYNGGPKHINRYRRNESPSSLQAIDKAFWKKFEIIQLGNTLAVAKCFTGER